MPVPESPNCRRFFVEKCGKVGDKGPVVGGAYRLELLCVFGRFWVIVAGEIAGSEVERG